jgi:hypothetical protein
MTLYQIIMLILLITCNVFWYWVANSLTKHAYYRGMQDGAQLLMKGITREIKEKEKE